MYVVEVLLLVCTYIVCIVHMYVLLISGKTAQLKSLLANFFRLMEDQMNHYGPGSPKNVKKPSLTVNVINVDFFYFNVCIPYGSLGVPLSKKSQYVRRIIQIYKICGEKQGEFCCISKFF